MRVKTWSIICLFVVFLFETLIETQGQFYFSKRWLTRGADTAEIYINCPWYKDANEIIWKGLFYSSDNGQSLTLKRKRKWFEEYGLIFGDSIQGRIFQLPMDPSFDTLGISFDFGENFSLKYCNHIYYSAAGCMAGEIYIQASELGMGIYRSTDYGDTFTLQISNDSLELREVGTLPGELYCYNWIASTGPLGLAYSNDYGQTFTTSYLEFQGAPTFDECMIYRGTEPGEIYFVIWVVNSAKFYLFHTFDYGQTITFQSQLPYPSDEMMYTAGRTPGTFYVVRRNFLTHSVLYIYFSRDYGVTYTTYVHDLDSTYTGISYLGLQEKGLSCYPNPVSDQLTVTWGQHSTYSELQLYNLTGRIQLTTRIATRQKKALLDLSSQKPGIYLLKVTDGKRVIGVEKVVVE